MRLAIMAVLVTAGAAHDGAAQAAELAPPVCSEPRVLQQLDEMIRVRGQALVLEPMPVGEVSTAPPGGAALSPAPSPALAHCAVRGHTTGYDTNRYGMTPVNEPFIVNYTIELRHNGLFVSLD